MPDFGRNRLDQIGERNRSPRHSNRRWIPRYPNFARARSEASGLSLAAEGDLRCPAGFGPKLEIRCCLFWSACFGNQNSESTGKRRAFLRTIGIVRPGRERSMRKIDHPGRDRKAGMQALAGRREAEAFGFSGSGFVIGIEQDFNRFGFCWVTKRFGSPSIGTSRRKRRFSSWQRNFSRSAAGAEGTP